MTNAQKVQILAAIGVPPTALDENHRNYSKTIADRLGSISGDVEALVVEHLTKITRIDTKLDEAVDRAGVSKVEDIEINPLEMDILRRERKKIIKAMASICDLEGFMSIGSAMGSVII